MRDAIIEILMFLAFFGIVFLAYGLIRFCQVFLRKEKR